VAAPLTVEGWDGRDVRLGQVEAELARLRGLPAAEGRGSQQRTSVMTHVAWVPPDWLDAAERTLEGMAERHPSRTIILVPHPDSGQSRIDAEIAVRWFPAGDRSVCGELIELHLHGERARAPASIVLPLLISDLPVFLRWRGEPVFDGPQWVQLVEVADRVVVDSSEWRELRYRELAEAFGQAAVSDIAWARLLPWRLELAGRWPGIRDQEIEIRGPRAEAALLRGWLCARLERVLPPAASSRELGVRVEGDELAPQGAGVASPSDLLSAELERFGRDRVYEQAALAAAQLTGV